MQEQQIINLFPYNPIKLSIKEVVMPDVTTTYPDFPKWENWTDDEIKEAAKEFKNIS